MKKGTEKKRVYSQPTGLIMQVNVYITEAEAVEHGQDAVMVGHFGISVSETNGQRWFSGIGVCDGVWSALQARHGPQAPEMFFGLVRGPCEEYVATDQCAAMMATVSPSFTADGENVYVDLTHVWFVVHEA